MALQTEGAGCTDRGNEPTGKMQGSVRSLVFLDYTVGGGRVMRNEAWPGCEGFGMLFREAVLFPGDKGKKQKTGF